MVTKQVSDNNSRFFVTYERSLAHMPNAQAGISHIYNDGGSYDLLVSYRTPVAWVNEDGWFGCNGLYSMTTRRHIGAFAKEYGLSFHDFKRAYEEGIEINRFTNEERRLEI